MEDEVVRRRHWLTRDEFLDLLGVVSLIPSPNSTEMAIQIGYAWKGRDYFDLDHANEKNCDR